MLCFGCIFQYFQELHLISIPERLLLDLTNTNQTMSKSLIKPKPNAVAKQLHPKLPVSLSQKNQEQSSLSFFRQALAQMHQKRQNSQNGYEKVISALQEVVEELFQKNDFLAQQRLSLVRQNCQLKKQNESLSSIIEVKKRLGDSVIIESSQIFDILIESSSASRGISKHEDSYECGNTIGNILEQNSNIANRQEFIIQSNPLSQNISQLEESQISMSNIGKTQIVNNNLQTPGLSKENIYIQCSSKTSDGIIRAFYLSVMQKKQTAKHLVEIIQSLRHDITTVIFEPYPTNEFWIQMLCNFLKIAHEGHFDTQVEVLQYIKLHRLIDTLMIKCLKSRIQFLFYNAESFDIPETAEIMRALANEFCLRMQIIEDQYVFFTKQAKDQKLSSNDRASLQISLNNKQSNVYYVKEQEPCFSILERQDCLQFSFFIVVECELGISQYEINEDYLGKDQSFRCNESQNESFKIGENQFQLNFGGNSDHLDGVVSVLNEKDSNIQECKDKRLTRNFGHRRYPAASPSSKKGKSPLNSSRFFLNRVASKNSSIDQNS